MYSLLVVSPDPETNEIFKLRFELEGYEVTLGLQEKATETWLKHVSPQLLIIDLVSQTPSEEREARQLMETAKKLRGIKCILLPPRGFKRTTSSHAFSSADLMVCRPFELEWLVAKVNALVIEKKEEGKKKRKRKNQ